VKLGDEREGGRGGGIGTEQSSAGPCMGEMGGVAEGGRG